MQEGGEGTGAIFQGIGGAGVIGQGVEDGALRAAMPDAEFAGVLRGEALAKAYAEMDCFDDAAIRLNSY